MPSARRAADGRADNVLRRLRELHRFVQAFGQVQLIRVWSDIDGYTSDWQPVMGPSARVPACTTPSASMAKGLHDQPGRGHGRADGHRSNLHADLELPDRPLRARGHQAGGLKQFAESGWRDDGVLWIHACDRLLVQGSSITGESVLGNLLLGLLPADRGEAARRETGVRRLAEAPQMSRRPALPVQLSVRACTQTDGAPSQRHPAREFRIER